MKLFKISPFKKTFYATGLRDDDFKNVTHVVTSCNAGLHFALLLFLVLGESLIKILLYSPI
jgi:hypothetical protein